MGMSSETSPNDVSACANVIMKDLEPLHQAIAISACIEVAANLAIRADKVKLTANKFRATADLMELEQ